MSILDKRYDRLGPDLELLCDEAVLAQAWKKTDAYIRRHNWYADTLELEQTSLLLPAKLQSWGAQLKAGDFDSATPLRLVLAPKNAKWYFPKGEASGWVFRKTVGADGVEIIEPDLRPLAHVPVREQTLATAVMMCLADAIETLQGNTDAATYTSAAIARQHVCSYGNRLFCDWRTTPGDVQQAKLRWGNATTYSQFFQDYERFLERPAEVCRELLPTLQGERLFVVNLDLAKFYDCVEQKTVTSRLRSHFERYAKQFSVVYDPAEAEPFWQVAEKVLRWEWDEQDLDKPLGLPQGLVASGFLANAYMYDFDQVAMMTVRQGIRIPITSNTPLSVRLLDYCRYVDDIRLVIAVPEEAANGLPLEAFTKSISAWANLMLGHCFPETSGQLKIKEEKSEAVAWEDCSVQGSTSRFMRSVQGQISTAPDPASLLQATGSLDHLLWLADALEEDADVDANPLELARISLPQGDVRDDTVKRFAANRLRQVLRLRRSMADPDLPAEDGVATTGVSELQALDHEMEAIARKLVACWSRNPSLVTVLRCGLDLFPSTELLRPVIEALKSKLKVPSGSAERSVAEYALADLFRAGAVETGLHRPESYPSTANIEAYRTELLQLALELTEDASLPWFLHQQAALYLAAMHYPVMLNQRPELKAYRALHSALRFERPSSGNDAEALTAGLLVMRITGQREKFAIWLGGWLQSLKAAAAKTLIDQVAMIEPQVLKELLLMWGATDRASWILHLKHYVASTNTLDVSERLHDWSNVKRSLAAIVAHPENPFVQENALLKLTKALLEQHAAELNDDRLSISRILLSCDNWAAIQRPGAEISLFFSAKKSSQFNPPWNVKPSWCSDDMAWAYRLGRLLRSAIIGESDFTTRFFAVREEKLDRYRGLQSSWYKRRMGLAPLTNGLGEEPTPVSPWLNELVMRLLQWPGLEINREEVSEFSEIKQPADLLRLVNQRLAVQKTFYGKLSELPVYLLPVDSHPQTTLRKFKVALVQTLMPKDTEVCEADPLLWPAAYRARHRAHLAAMCRLLGQQLVATRFASRKPDDPEGLYLDLIVFPELSVHPDDMWLLHRLSDSTKATIFAGQTFVEHAYLKKPINRAVWLLRQKNRAGRQLVRAFQGKQHGTSWEVDKGIVGHRPYQVVVQFNDVSGAKANLTGAICYDATDLRLAADMRDLSDGFVVTALNRDINTFDTMAGALQFHMYQPVMLANTGQYGGSTAQAPYREHYDRQIAHVHGHNQAAISLFDIDLQAFKSLSSAHAGKKKKTPPAGYKGRPAF